MQCLSLLCGGGSKICIRAGFLDSNLSICVRVKKINIRLSNLLAVVLINADCLVNND